ncbi:MAG: peptidoglycan DD-metalloendopeptidase family protein [Anaerolineae bacterium]|nr:peptidoglycan DD-metalloendopeptidase family protein [Anaerolineae bacterium]
MAAQENPPLPVYIVQPGETLSTIAVRFGTTVDEIIRVNDLTNPNAIAAGSKLRIPGLEGIEGTLVTETVPFGDNLKTLSISHKFPLQLMTKLNRITSPGEIYAGSVLVVPQQDPEEVMAPQTSIEDSESLLEIAVKNNTNPWIYHLSNNLKGSWDLTRSQIIFGPELDKREFSPISPWIHNITISPLPLVQGKTIEVFIETEFNLEVSGNLGKYPLLFYSLPPKGYFALIGVEAISPLGLYPVSLYGKTTDGQTFEYSQQVLLVSGNYPQEYVVGVDATTIETEIIQSEDQILSEIRGSEPIPMWTAPFRYPVDEPYLGSRFGNRRSYNQGEYNFYHTGVDFIVNADNLNIYAPAPGVVKFTGNLPIKGNFTVIDHGLGVYSGYAHQSEILVKQGDRVETGQQIGVIGNTGRSVGPHLHWEIWVNNVPVDPIDWVDNLYPTSKITP